MISLLRHIRHWYLVRLKWRKYSIGNNVYFGRSVYMWAKHSISIGDNFYIGKYSQIECDTEIGNNVMFANFVALIGRHDHDFRKIGMPVRLAGKIRDDDYKGEGLREKIVINDDVWIGHGSIILSGVTIGQGSIIGAGSVVTKDVEPFSIYAGNPAAKIKARFSNEEQKIEHIKLYNLKYKRRNL
jgi:acetyltransferase-like isoleucine patch superfamily enzyme